MEGGPPVNPDPPMPTNADDHLKILNTGFEKVMAKTNGIGYIPKSVWTNTHVRPYLVASVVQYEYKQVRKVHNDDILLDVLVAIRKNHGFEISFKEIKVQVSKCRNEDKRTEQAWKDTRKEYLSRLEAQRLFDR
jgi:DNA-binding protein